MLSLIFKEKLSEEQEDVLFNELEGYLPMKVEFDVDGGFDQKISVYVKNRKTAVDVSSNVRNKGFRCGASYCAECTFFHPDLIAEASKERPLEYAHVVEIRQQKEELERRLAEGMKHDNETNNEEEKGDVEENGEPPSDHSSPAPTPSSPEPSRDTKPLLHHFNQQNFVAPSPPQNYVTCEQFERLSKQIEILTAQNRQLAANMTPTSSPAPARLIKSAEYTAKNELIANGLRCEKCHVTIRGIDPIGRLMMAVRDHVMTHFDSENPILKRYECRKCPQFRTNFVDDIENHLKKHGSMTSMQQKRLELVHNLVTDTHLKLICALSIACFPEVFEKTPPSINTILAVDTPAKAKASVFPPFDRVFCTKYKIPSQCNARSSLPTPLVQL